MTREHVFSRAKNRLARFTAIQDSVPNKEFSGVPHNSSMNGWRLMRVKNKFIIISV